MTLYNRNRSEKGNILFLILLAVVLFAALSYAVTQSLRGGGTNASSEKNLVKSASITSYPVGVRAAILRMIVGGTDATTLNFDPPSVFSNLSAAQAALNVFHPDGGGAVFSFIPADALATSSDTARWYFNYDFEVPGIGTSSSGSTDGNDLIAFAPGLASALCTKIDSELGTTSVPTMASTLTVAVQQNVKTDAGANNTYTPYSTSGDHIAESSGSATSGKAFLCVDNGGSYTYYHVLVER